MRKIKRIVFCGSPSCIDEIRIARRRFNDALNILSGVQQPAHSPSEEIAKENEILRKKDLRNLRDAVSDIATAFGYKLHRQKQCTFPDENKNWK